MSIFLFMAAGTVATLSMMMVSSATKSSLYDLVVPQNLMFNRLSSIHFLTASICSSSLIVPYLFSNLFVSLMNVLRMSPTCSTSFPLSLSEMLRQTCSSDRISLQSRATLRIPSALMFVAFFSVVRLLLFCARLGVATRLFFPPHLNNPLQVCGCQTCQCSQR